MKKLLNTEKPFIPTSWAGRSCVLALLSAFVAFASSEELQIAVSDFTAESRNPVIADLRKRIVL
jgi:hypothetical protein